MVISLSYPDGQVVRVPKGWSVLEASLLNGIPHASVCGGRARCSTCRIRIVGDVAALPPPSPREAFVLDRVGAGGDPAVRLACQLRPLADLAFYLIFPPQTSAGSLRRSGLLKVGEGRYVVAHVLRRHAPLDSIAEKAAVRHGVSHQPVPRGVSHAVEEAGGRPNQFVGDGLLALFGLDRDPEAACRGAIAAIGGIAANVDKLNTEFAHDLREPIRFGIGVNGGEVIVGDIGYKQHLVFTALGDAVNVAARLQDMTKELGCEALISDDVCRRAGLAPDALPAREVAIRGRSAPLHVRAVEDARRVLTDEKTQV